MSVIMIAYNQEDYIARAIESVLAQKVPFDYELLIGDDASTDGTAQTIRRYAEKYPDRIKAYFRHENIGASANAVDLLLQSRGEYLAFCEGDDFWIDTEKLARQVSFLEKNPVYIGCAHSCLVVNEREEVLPKQRVSWLKPGKRVFTFRDFSGGRFLPGQTSTVVKRNLFLHANDDMIGMMMCDHSISDRISNLIYLLQGNFYCFPECYGAYRCVEQPSSITARKYRDNPDACLAELSMTERMETYASNRLGRKIRFVRKRSEILTVAFAYWLLKRNDECKRVLKTVFSQMTCSEIVLIPFAILKKLKDQFLCVQH